jgi:hypothetical protein
MNQKKSTLTSTVTIDCSWKRQFVRRHLVIHGSPPYVTSVKAIGTEKELLPKQLQTLTCDMYSAVTRALKTKG